MMAREGMEYADSLATIVRAALAASRMSGIQDILQGIARQFECFGCVLWEASPTGTIASQNTQLGSLFAMAQWFENGQIWQQPDVPLSSATGYAILRGSSFIGSR